MDEEYFIRIRGRVQGPFDSDELRQLVRRGQLRKMHQISTDRQNWQNASEMSELFESPVIRQQKPESELVLAEAVEVPVAEGDQIPPPPADGQWYYAQADAQLGPVDLATLQNKFRMGELAADTEVWTEGMSDWKPARDVPGVLPVVSSDEVEISVNSNGVRRRKRPKTVHLVVFGLAIVAMLLVGTIASLIFKGDGTGSKSLFEQLSSASAGRALTSIKDHAALQEAVGLIVVGSEVITSDGRLIQLPAIYWPKVRGASGTAFAIGVNGIMLTNHHVVEEFINAKRGVKSKKKHIEEYNLTSAEERLWVFIAGEKYQARVLYSSKDHDLAIIKVEDHKFARTFRIKNSSEGLLDRKVRAVGFPGVASNPFTDLAAAIKVAKFEGEKEDVAKYYLADEFIFSLTSGSVSKVREDEGTGSVWLQHSADIETGNSGGPLVDMECIVVGVNTLGWDAAKVRGNFNLSQCLGQHKEVIDKHAPDAIWVP